MATPPRKTLGLPPPGKGDAATTITDRKPIRGGQAKSRHKPLAESPVVAKALPQQKPRGTPSRAPVVPKAGSLAHSPTRPAALSPIDKAPQTGVRISKLMAERGLCSRREADSYIERGWVFVDGERVMELGTRADPSAVIKLDKGARAALMQQMTILLHKPVESISSRPAGASPLRCVGWKAGVSGVRY